MKNRLNTKFIREHRKQCIITVVVLMVLIVFCFFLYQFDKQEKTQQALSFEEKEQLTDITSHLNEMDEVIVTNRDNLAETLLSQTDTQSILKEFSETIVMIEEDIVQVEKSILEHSELEKLQNEEIKTSLTEITGKQEELRNQLQTVNEGISSTLSEMMATDESRYTNTLEKLADIKKEIEKTQEETKEYYEALTEFLTLFQEENLLQYETMMETLLTVQMELTDLLNERFDALENLINEDFMKLMQRLDEVHTRIEEAESNIRDLSNAIEENNESRHEEIRESFSQIGITLEEIREEYNMAHAELQQLIVEFQETENDNHQKTLTTLTTMESNMTSSITEQTNNMNIHMSSLTGNLQHQFEILSATVNHYDTGQQESMDNLLTYLDEKLTQVFQYVSSGKKLLASALLTKGVGITEDATFEEIYQAILRIPQKLVIGVAELPGTISYDKHYHLDGNGGNPHTTSVGTAQAGGCYRNPIYHAHSGNSSSGGGCYSVANTGYDTIGCGGGDCTSGPFGPDSSGNVYYVGDCSNCGAGLTKYGSPGWVGCGNTTTVSYTYYTTGCGMSTSTIIGYSPSCGLSDGQIIGAHIIYKPAYASSIQTAALMMADIPEEEIMAEEMGKPKLQVPAETVEMPKEDAAAEKLPENPLPGENSLSGNTLPVQAETEEEGNEESEGAEDVPEELPKDEVVTEEMGIVETTVPEEESEEAQPEETEEKESAEAESEEAVESQE